MNSRSARIVDDPAPTAELVAPLSGPSYGAYNIVKRRWRKPLPAIIADALVNNRAIIARLKLGIYGPDAENTPHYQQIFDQVCRCTSEQIKALEAFAAIDWRG
jgi:hypothetical protein